MYELPSRTGHMTNSKSRKGPRRANQTKGTGATMFLFPNVYIFAHPLQTGSTYK